MAIEDRRSTRHVMKLADVPMGSFIEIISGEDVGPFLVGDGPLIWADDGEIYVCDVEETTLVRVLNAKVVIEDWPEEKGDEEDQADRARGSADFGLGDRPGGAARDERIATQHRHLPR